MCNLYYHKKQNFFNLVTATSLIAKGGWGQIENHIPYVIGSKQDAVYLQTLQIPYNYTPRTAFDSCVFIDASL